MMKKIILPVILCSVLAISCSKDDDNNSIKTQNNEIETLILGKWKIKKQQIIKSSNGEVVDFDLSSQNKCFNKSYNEFLKNGKYIAKQYIDENGSCKEQVLETSYTINKLNATLEIKDLVYPNQEIQKLNQEELVLKSLGHDFDQDGKEDYRIYTYDKIK
ncbi:lipocalin family protein [Riemerella columbipharyngis]|uniref:Lipocalin-like domain-containing protein n=1 Tax=Riemerella columbipharyngis TaxID=1071918 RepID=A0A1G7BLS4_9FLAO|nr:lipocalin family protein [Riemerella columbipharyngis]SDE27416.1 hypothetical protein SAMN05421544_10625 [Riemerella columbipharyngis]